MQQRTLEQQIAEAEARLARLRSQSRQLENGQKIILGGMLLAAARYDPKIRAWVIKEAGKAVTGDSGEAERSFRREAERHSEMNLNTIGA